LTWSKTVAPGSISFENVPLPTIVRVSPLRFVNQSANQSSVEKYVRNGWVGCQVDIIDGENVVFRIGTELEMSAI
jgi:hypothetical protein